MNAQSNDGAKVRLPPPLCYLGALGAGVSLQEFARPLPMGLSTGQAVALGLPALLLGLALVWGALRLFRATGQNPKPWHATPEIIRTGVYRFTRNPMYLGLALIQTAIGIGLGNLWVLLFVPLACLIVHYTAILPEEVYLERKFGSAYLDYRQRVRRWL